MANTRTSLIEVIQRSLGASLIDIELDPEDYMLAIDKAMEQYRQQSENSTEESLMFMELQENVTTYILPSEVVEVREIFRKSMGNVGSGTEINPFELSFINTYMLQLGTAPGGIATYYMYSMYMEELGKIFGAFIDFIWSDDQHRLQIMRRPTSSKETILLWVYNEKPEEVLLNGRYSYPWLRDWAIAEAKEILGTGYRKYQSIPGPSGAITLPGNELIAEAKEMKTELRERLRNYESGERPATFVIG